MSFLTQLSGFNSSSLALLQRILLVSDGTLTDTIEVTFREPIVVKKITLALLKARRRIDVLDLAEGQSIMDRRILLLGSRSGRAYVYAESLLAVDRLPPRFEQRLIESSTPLGRLWAEYKIEVWKELLSVSQVSIGDLACYFNSETQTELLKRTYRVISGGNPIMVITEYFPLTYPEAVPA
jgi:chorismate-pyruvate lyase